MGYTAPRTWVAGEVVTHTLMNTHVRDNLLALSEIARTWTYAQTFNDDIDIKLGTGADAVIRWSDADSSNHALSVGLGDSNQALHITDLGAIATDWNIAATTHPNVYIHSNTTPATDYLRLGGHTGTTADIDVVGGTTLNFQIAGATEVSLTASKLDVASGTQLDASDTTASTSTTTGSFISAGGIGVVNDSFFGADVDIAGSLAIGANANIGTSVGLNMYTNFLDIATTATSAGIAITNLIGRTSAGSVTDQSGGLFVNGRVDSTNARDFTHAVGVMGMRTQWELESASYTVTGAAGLYVRTSEKGGSVTLTNAYGIYIATQDQASNNYGIWIERGDIILDDDAAGGKIIFGEGQDASIDYDGTNLIIDSSVAGSGITRFTGGDVEVANGFGLVIGHTAQQTVGLATEFQVLGTAATDSSMILGQWPGASGAGPSLRFTKSRHGTIGSHAKVADNDTIGDIIFYPDDGVDYDTVGCRFQAQVDDGAPATGDIGMAFVWEQAAGAGSGAVETLRLSAAGQLEVATATVSTASGNGSFITAGGIGVALNSFFGADLDVAGTIAIGSAGAVLSTTMIAAKHIVSAALGTSIDGKGIDLVMNAHRTADSSASIIGVKAAVHVSGSNTHDHDHPNVGIAAFSTSWVTLSGGSGTVTGAAGLYIPNGTVIGAAVTNGYGIYIEDQTAASNDYGIYIAGADTAGIFTQDSIRIGTNDAESGFDDASGGSSSTTMYIGNQSITTSSDARLKADITDTTINAVDTLEKLRVVDFRWDDPSDQVKNNKNARGRWTGMLAQETVDVVPYIINAPRTDDGEIDRDSERNWFVDYQHLVPMLVKAVQELRQEHKDLKSQLERTA